MVDKNNSDQKQKIFPNQVLPGLQSVDFDGG